MFSGEICDFFKITFLKEHLQLLLYSVLHKTFYKQTTTEI